MDRPRVILHMLISADGKITGEYMQTPVAAALCEEYYRINREYRADAFLCGRVTMEGSFTQGVSPDLTPFQGVTLPREDYVAKRSGYYAVAIDPAGRLGWQASEIADEDPGYDGAHIVEAVSQRVTDEYLAFLRDKGISYLFCGKERVEVSVLLEKLSALFGIRTLLLEGGGITDAAFLEADLIDEMSLVLVPVAGGEGGKDLFEGHASPTREFALSKAEVLPNGGVWLNYQRKK